MPGVAAGLAATLVDAKGDLLVGTADDTVARKAVGANGKFLMGDSSQSDGLLYSAAAPWVHQAGQYYQIPGFDTSIHEQVMTLNQEWCHPFPIAVNETITSLWVKAFTTVATSVCRLGVRQDAGGIPGTLLADAGTVTTSTGGDKSITGLSIACKPPLVWITTTGQTAAPDLYGMIHNTTALLSPWRGANPGFAPSSGYYQTGVTGALPSTFTSAGYIDTSAAARILVGF